MRHGSLAPACLPVGYEFSGGPVSDEHKQIARALLDGRIEPVTEVAAELAVRLYNATGRMRRTRTDALIAACAISTGAEFATVNRADFERGIDELG